MKQGMNPRADQPRFLKKDLTKGYPALQYRTQGAKNYGSRIESKTSSRKTRS